MNFFDQLNHRKIGHSSTSHIFNFLDNDFVIQHLEKERVLSIHNGCVNTLHWHHTGEFLLSGSDDRHLMITDALRTFDVDNAEQIERHSLPVNISPNDSIFCAKYLPPPYDNFICSSTRKGAVLIHPMDDFLSPLQGSQREPIFRHEQGVMDIVTFPAQPQCFLSIGLDKKACWFDLRSTSTDEYPAAPQYFWKFRVPLTAGAVHPYRTNELALAASDGIVRILDLRKLTRTYDSEVDILAFCHPLGMRFCNTVNGSSIGHDFRHITGINYHNESGGCYLAVSHMFRGIFVYNTSMNETESDAAVEWDTSMWDAPQVQIQNNWEMTGPSPNPANHRVPAHFVRFYTLMHSAMRRTFSLTKDADTETELGHAIRYRQVASLTGHRNGQTVLKDPIFWGSDYLLSGSECGHVFIWNWRKKAIVAALLADDRVINRIRPHPFLPMLATSGLSYDVKLWSPRWTDVEPSVDVATLIQTNTLHNFEGINIRLSEFIRIMIALRRTTFQNEGPPQADNSN